MDLWKTITDIMTTVIEYFRTFDVSKAGDFFSMIMKNFNAATLKDTLEGLGAFLSDIVKMLGGA